MHRPQWIPSRSDLPGIALAAAVGAVALLIAWAIPPSPLVSDVLFALLLGALLLNTPLRRALRLAPPTTEREPDRYAAGMRFTGKWVLRAGIILMGLKVQTNFFGRTEVALIAGVAATALPSAFFVAHALGARLGVRRPMVDVLAGGTMICGASAVNAMAPVARAHRDEQGLAIGVVFLFSVVALLIFRPIALVAGINPSFAGLWSGLAVNDLSSAMAVGSQMGGDGGVMAAAAKSARVLLLAPTLVTLSILRREPAPRASAGAAPKSLRGTIVEQLPGFLLGYIGLAAARAAGDRLFGADPAWVQVLTANRFFVDLCMVTVSAAIGLHLDLRKLLASGARAIAVGGGASMWMASLTLAMVTAASRGAPAAAALIGVVGLLASYVAYRASTGADVEAQRLRARFESGAPLSLAEATRLLDATEREGPLEDGLLRQTLAQLYPSIGELIPVRESPLAHGEGCRWVTYWEGRSGWALVAVAREPGSATPIHAHPHRLLGKAIEGVLEELRFAEDASGGLTLTTRQILAHNDLVETDGLATLHVVRVVGANAAIDLQLRGPEVGSPGRRLRTRAPLDFASLAVGARIEASEEIDDRPGQGGEGAGAGRAPAPPGA
jgi:uncharacterized integral membrane protein (TIGR00698 family)